MEQKLSVHLVVDVADRDIHVYRMDAHKKRTMKASIEWIEGKVANMIIMSTWIGGRAGGTGGTGRPKISVCFFFNLPKLGSQIIALLYPKTGIDP
jgi:hypothetical protein